MENMLERVEAYAQQLEKGLQMAQVHEWQPADTGVPTTEIVLLGLGGSAFGGEIVRNFIYESCKIPFLVYRGYTVPAHVGINSLVLISSYSGNTEETRAAASQAQKQGARIVVISSGGELSEWAKSHAETCFPLPRGYPPRSACGFSIVQQLEILKRLEFITDYVPELRSAIRKIKGFSGQTHLKDIAQQATGKWISIYSEDRIESVAIRLRQQINENAKQLCHHHVVPEMNHNELVGWELPETKQIPRLYLFLRHENENPRNRMRFDFMTDEAKSKEIPVVSLKSDAKDMLVALFDLLHQSDLLSCYLADANKVDPTPVEIIDRLKYHLAQKS